MTQQAASSQQRAVRPRRRLFQAGFTLVEMIIAVGLFAIVMLVSTAALLSLVDANKKAQALQSVMNNLNIALDSMVRGVRMGSVYHCGPDGALTAAQDCPDGARGTLADGGAVNALFAYEPYYEGGTPPPRTLYWFQTDGNGVGRLYKSEDGTLGGGLPITAPDVSIQSVSFYVTGSSNADNLQPKVLIVVKGTAGGGNVKAQTSFHIQATAVQRVLDL